jgi:LuxR family maltose regulon positive regulatory protein
MQWGEPELLTSAHLVRARVRLSTGDLDGVYDALREARRVAEPLSAWYVDRVIADEIGLLLALGQTEQAAQRAGCLTRVLPPGGPADLTDGRIGLALVRLAIAQGALERALAQIPSLLALYRSAGSIDGQIRILVQLCIALQARGEGTQAQRALQQALVLAEPEGYVRVFVEGGRSLAGLLQRALAEGAAAGYVRTLLQADAQPAGPGPASATQPPAPLLDPLTERELQVLRLLTTHLSSTEIAQQLYVSKNTARSHIGHIYDKLGVHSRDDAVQRAHELGLI